MVVGDAYQLTVNYNPTNTTDDKTVVWSSSDESVVTVSENGEITAVGVGTATITATTSSGYVANNMNDAFKQLEEMRQRGEI
jgi:uncharacterized protein YjdB